MDLAELGTRKFICEVQYSVFNYLHINLSLFPSLPSFKYPRPQMYASIETFKNWIGDRVYRKNEQAFCKIMKLFKPLRYLLKSKIRSCRWRKVFRRVNI